MIKHIILTLAATFLACGTLIALPDSVTSTAHGAPVAVSDRAAECDAALAHALPELADAYRDLCVRGYAIEGVAGRADADADACAETIMAELDVIAEGSSASVPAPDWQTLVADCRAMGDGPAYSKHVGPALPSCVWEDGSGSDLPCAWRADIQGNGKGTSYIVTDAP